MQVNKKDNPDQVKVVKRCTSSKRIVSADNWVMDQSDDVVRVELPRSLVRDCQRLSRVLNVPRNELIAERLRDSIAMEVVAIEQRGEEVRVVGSELSERPTWVLEMKSSRYGGWYPFASGPMSSRDVAVRIAHRMNAEGVEAWDSFVRNCLPKMLSKELA